MQMNGKRRPIRRRVVLIVLLVSLVAMTLASGVSIVSMLSIRNTSREALQQQLEINLSNTIADKAALADAQFGKYREYINGFATQIHDMYVHPENYASREVKPPKASNKGILAMQRYLRDSTVTTEAVREEINLLGNLEDEWYAAVSQNEKVITTVYLGTESGLHVAYDTASDLGVEEGSAESHFDYSHKEWYALAKETGEGDFTDIYPDSYRRGLMVSVYAPFLDAKNQFAGSVSMDMLIEDIYQQIVSMDLGEGGSVYLVDEKGYTLDPNRKNQLVEINYLINDQTVVEAMRNGKSGFGVSDDGIYYVYAPVESTGWMLCIGIPESTVMSSVEAMDRNIRTAILLFTGVFLVLLAAVVLVSLRFSKTLTDPLIALGKDAHTISGGNLDYRAKVQRNDEIGDLAVSFNDMAGSLKQYIADLTRVTAEKERIGAELNVATKIQADMLPRIFPAFPGRTEIDIFAAMDPAKEVGGDFYDFFLVDDDHLCMVMADVSGKGVPAALFMVIAKTLIKNQAQLGKSPAEILYNVNNQLCDGNEMEMFVTVWLAILDMSTGKGVAANAGHEHPALCRKNGKYELVEYRHSPAVAVMEEMRFKEHEFILYPGDHLFVYTDGVPEATNAEKELFGSERMLTALNRQPDANPRKVLKHVRQAVDDFVQDAEQFDDLTMLCLEYNGPEEITEV